MFVRPDKRNIPTVARAVDYFLEREEAARKKDLGNLRSVLKGPRERVIGKKAAGPALANSELGKLPCYRITSLELTRCFQQRHPAHLAPATVKRGMSTMRSFLSFCVKQRWMDEEVLEACFSVPDSNPRREWLHPEQHDAISLLVEKTEELDDYQRFAYRLLGDLGLRTEEATTLRTSSLDPRAKVVRVVGKGRGEGKERSIPVDDVIIARWNAHIERHGIRRGGPMLFHRRTRFIGGSNVNFEWIIDKSRTTTPKTLRTLMEKVTELGERELSAELVPHFRLTPKIMRRTFACTQLILHALNLGGMDVRTLQLAMGHARLDTTERYLADAQEYIGAVKRHLNTRDGARLIAELRRNADDSGSLTQ
jgi:site-specific recombinase XerD